MGLFSHTPAPPPKPDRVIRGQVSRVHVSVLRQSYDPISSNFLEADNLGTVIVLQVEGHGATLTVVDAHGTQQALTQKGDQVEVALNDKGQVTRFVNHTLSRNAH
jgi:hypothetical protein